MKKSVFSAKNYSLFCAKSAKTACFSGKLWRKSQHAKILHTNCKNIMEMRPFYRDICLLNFVGVLSKMEEPFSEKRRTIRMKKAVVTVLGQDKVGITAKICGVLAETNINILDISQTIVGGYFNMVMVVDITEAKDTFEETAEKLHAVGKELGMKIKIQHTEIFDAMHRI